jgi:hypothetical protein
LPEGVAHIGRGAFLECRSLSSIVIPGATSQIECRAFSGCKSLRVYVAASSRDYVAKDGSLYRRVKITEGERTYNSLSLLFLQRSLGLKNVVLEKGVLSLCYGALTRLGTTVETLDLSETPIKRIGEKELVGTGGEKLTVITKDKTFVIERKDEED